MTPTTNATAPSSEQLAPPRSCGLRLMFVVRWFWKIGLIVLAGGLVVLDVVHGWAATNWFLGIAPCSTTYLDGTCFRLSLGTWNLNWQGLVMDVTLTALFLIVLLVGWLFWVLARASFDWLESAPPPTETTTNPELGNPEKFVQLDGHPPPKVSKRMFFNPLMLCWILLWIAFLSCGVLALMYTTYGLQIAFFGQGYVDGWVFVWVLYRLPCVGVIAFLTASCVVGAVNM